MANTIKLKKSAVADNAPSSLEYGEVALNYADGNLYYKNTSNAIDILNAKNADTLDGEHGSYYQPASTALTTSTTFGGDVSGPYNNIVVADDSHTHDTRYYTESEVQTFLNRSYISSENATNLAVGWYTIATNTGNRASARFGIWDQASSKHQSVTFYAAHHYGTDASNTLTVLDNAYYSGNPFRYIRIKDGGPYDGAALQVYIDDSSNNVFVAILGDNFQTAGWVLRDWIPDATTPPDVNNYGSFAEVAKVDLNNIAQGGFATTGPIYADGDLAQYKVLTTADEGPGNGLDADTLDGQHGSYYAAASSINGTDNYIPRFNGTSALENSNIYDDGTNIGIGTDTPSAKLHIYDDTDSSIAIGKVGDPSNLLSIDYNNGWATFGTERFDDLHLKVADTTAIQIEGASNEDRFNVDVTLGNLSVSTDNKYLKLGGSEDAGITYDGTNMVFDSQLVGAGDFVFNNGNVGIGTTSPTNYKLDVVNTNDGTTEIGPFRVSAQANAGTVAVFENTVGINTSLRISDTVDDMYVVSRNGIMGLGPSAGWSSTNLNITSGGFVGIGYRNPSERLHVKNGNLRVENGRINFYSSSSSINTTNRGYVGPNGSALEISSTNKILFKTSADLSEKMRLTDDGRLLLNAPDNASAYNSRFEAIGNSADASTNMTFKTNGKLGLGDYDPIAKITVVGSTNTTTSNLMQITNTSNIGSVIDFRNSGGEQAGLISMPTSTTVNYGSTSDYRLKTNVVRLENSIDRVKKLKPSRFEWINDGVVVDGFIAHEVSEVIPEAINGEKDAVDENNNPIYQTIDQSKIIPLLTSALQEAIEKIEQLETRIQTLQNK